MARRSDKRLFLVVALAGFIFVGVASLLIPGAALAGILDQQQPDASGGQSVVRGETVAAQTFTAGLSGVPDQVDLTLGRDASTTRPLDISLQTVSGGKPSAFALVFGSIPASSVVVGPAGASVAVKLAPAAGGFDQRTHVTAGVQYAIVAVAPSGYENVYYWGQSSNPSNPYAGGDAFYAPGCSFWCLSTFDFAFRTYVTPTFTVGKTTLNKHKGTAKVKLKLPGPGTIRLRGKGVKAASKTLSSAGVATLNVIPTGGTKKKLNKTGKAKVKLKTTYTPSSGTPDTKSKSITLIKQRRKFF